MLLKVFFSSDSHPACERRSPEGHRIRCTIKADEVIPTSRVVVVSIKGPAMDHLRSILLLDLLGWFLNK